MVIFNSYVTHYQLCNNFKAVTAASQVHRVAADAECGYRFFVDAKHERFREVDGKQDVKRRAATNGWVHPMGRYESKHHVSMWLNKVEYAKIGLRHYIKITTIL